MVTNEYRVLTIRVDVVEVSTEKEAKEKAEVEDIIYSCSTLALIEKSDSDDMFDTADYMLDMAEKTIKSRYDTGDILALDQWIVNMNSGIARTVTGKSRRNKNERL